MEYHFPRTFGQEPAKRNLQQALGQGRFPHALLIHGEAGLGQHALMLDLAQFFFCISEKGRPCQKCQPCKNFQSMSLEGVHYLMPLVKKEKESDKDGEESMDASQLDELADRIVELYKRPYGFECPEKAVVTVGQVRHLVSRLGFAESRHKARLVLVPYFEALNTSAANALLKTLEEPPEGVYFLLASEHRDGLLPTLLSRCLHLGLGPLNPDDFGKAAEALATTLGKPIPPRLWPLAEGSPGTLMHLAEHDGESQLEEALRFLSAATAPDWRLFADYVEQGPGEQGQENTASLLRFILRCIRLHQSLKIRFPGETLGQANGFRWTSHALQLAGWDASLVGYLGPLESVAIAPFAHFIETCLHAVKSHCRIQNALLGLFLEFQPKIRSESHSMAVIT